MTLGPRPGLIESNAYLEHGGAGTAVLAGDYPIVTFGKQPFKFSLNMIGNLA